MEFNFNCANNISGSVKVLQNGIFHIRIVPFSKADKVSALDKYGYLEKLPADKNSAIDCNDDNSLKISTADAILLFDKNSGCFELADKNGKILLKQNVLSFSNKKVNAVFDISADEDFAGFGDVSRERFFHRGERIACHIRNVKSYICVPFFMSTNGYGLLLNSTYRSIFDMDSSRNNTISVSDDGGVWDIYLFKGNNFKDLLTAYT